MSSDSNVAFVIHRCMDKHYIHLAVVCNATRQFRDSLDALQGGRFSDDEPRNGDTEEIKAKGRSAPEQPRPASSSIARPPSHSRPELTSPTSNDTAREIRGRSASTTSPRRRRLPFPHAGRSPLALCGMVEFPIRSHLSVLGAHLICRATVLPGRTGKKDSRAFCHARICRSACSIRPTDCSCC